MKPNKKTIAITGGIGSGKSTVAQILQEKGYHVLSCDQIYKEISQSTAYKNALKAEFGEGIFDEKGSVNRRALGKLIFSDENARKKLNAIAHPFIMDTLFERIDALSELVVFVEVPLLFEGEYEDQFDSVIVVSRPKEQRIADLINRDKFTIEEAEKRIRAQFDYDSKEGRNRIKQCKAAIIKNNSSLDDLTKLIEEYLIKHELHQT